MERTAVYRRALGSTTLLVGFMGLAASAAGTFFKLESPHAFVGFWMIVACATFGLAFAIVRRQSILDAEPFWSPPTKRVTQAVAPAFLVGLAVGIGALLSPSNDPHAAWRTVPLWMALYGCALYSAGFFMPRGIKLFGLLFTFLGSTLMVVLNSLHKDLQVPPLVFAHWVMGAAFGGLHVAYGTYIRKTETCNPSGA